MLQWISIILIFNNLYLAASYRRIYIVQVSNNNIETPITRNAIEVAIGANFTLRCRFESNQDSQEPGLTWGRRTNDLQFHNEYDLYKLLEDNNQHILDLENDSDYSGFKQFFSFKNSDRGAYFCMTSRYKLFKIVHIKIKNYTSPYCGDDKFRCISNGFCISSHYQCDGKADCRDGSDEYFELCNGDPCEGKHHCGDGRCIPKAWCCDRQTDRYCTISIRHPCCPFLPNPYDPLIWYNSQNYTKDVAKGTGPRYLFIAVCVVSAILSFVLFLFIISKVCGFDKKPPRMASNNINNNEACGVAILNCGHSECALNQLPGNSISCLYRTEEVSDPLIRGRICANNDQPPSYAEVVNIPPNIDKSTFEDLVNAPPPPYSSTKNVASIQESVCCDTNL